MTTRPVQTSFVPRSSSSNSSWDLLRDRDRDFLYGDISGGQSTSIDGQAYQLQPTATGTNRLVSYTGSDGRFGSNPELVGYTPPSSTPSANSGFGFNLPTFDMIGNVMGGVGSLAKGWAAIKGLGLAEDELEFKRGAFERNFAQQEQAYDDTVRQYNNAQAERQAFVNATHANPSLSDIRTLQLA